MKRRKSEEFSILWPQKTRVRKLTVEIYFASKYSRHDDVLSTLGVTHCDPPFEKSWLCPCFSLWENVGIEEGLRWSGFPETYIDPIISGTTQWQKKNVPYREINSPLMPCIALVSTFPKHYEPRFIHRFYLHDQCSHSTTIWTIWHMVKETHIATITSCKPGGLKRGLTRSKKMFSVNDAQASLRKRTSCIFNALIVIKMWPGKPE